MLLNDFIKDILTGIYKDWGNHKTFKIFASTINEIKEKESK